MMTYRDVTAELYQRIVNDPTVRHHEIETVYMLAIDNALSQVFVTNPEAVIGALEDQHRNDAQGIAKELAA